ncbi:lytic transglycosylase domain-containing protein [Cryobacterium gelidum]|uniref:Murein transglycosylase n=1 Tax=Cryobacterium gelidum TaxID=1259164 RepID=A0A4R9AYM7_9MICO|nr:lytic transglycosylase domain-containing protein [Cryobacterium gelidum]TFD72653.1 murein transglycosylase [Cryobacterium gelidum]
MPLCLVLALAAWLAGEAVSTAQPESTRSGASTEAHRVAEQPALVLPAPPPTGSPLTSEPPSATAGLSSTAAMVSKEWAASAAAATGIPLRALLGYAGAELRLAREQPGCGLGWATLAALGSIESDHGRNRGSAIDAGGTTVPGVFGPVLDGTTYAAFRDTDTGTLDGNPRWDRAVGPLQFIPATWAIWGADGNADGVADPQQIDDAALAAGRYLCDTGDLSTASSWRLAIYSYNHVDSYVDLVAATANSYTERMP